MESTKTNAEKAEAVREYERYCNGTNEWHKNIFGLVYTDGIKFLADTCGAYWLIDLVESYQPKLQNAPFQIWRVVAPGTELEGYTSPHDRWLVEAWSDTPGFKGEEGLSPSCCLVVQEIEYSDFPRELCEGSGFQFYVENGVALLKGER